MSTLTSIPNLKLIPQSHVVSEGAEWGLAREANALRLVLLTGDLHLLGEFQGEVSDQGSLKLLVGPTTPGNAAALRAHLPWLKPQLVGLRPSAGLGDRLGLATPGHVRALRAVGEKIAPIYAQQSIREMARTGRTPQQVMDDATWGMFQEGWRSGAGADADHLKTTADIDACAAAGFTFFTVDPGDHVNQHVETADLSSLRANLHELPWEQLQDDPRSLASRYLNKSFDIEGHVIAIDELTLFRAAVKYGRAVAHVSAMFQHLSKTKGDANCELEISVDETETPTSAAEHIYLANELKRLGVRWVSLAPRYLGRFEKGVDYIGDLAAFEADFAKHAAIARRFGPYKLSLHSGSDKFSIYPIAARLTQGLVHLKTAGTSYLEALRTIAAVDPKFFRALYTFARERYETDKASYHVSAILDKTPPPSALSDHDLPELLEQFDARQVLHVTFGSVLTERKADGGWRFYDHFVELLRANPEAYASNLERHFIRHLRPFV